MDAIVLKDSVLHTRTKVDRQTFRLIGKMLIIVIHSKNFILMVEGWTECQFFWTSGPDKMGAYSFAPWLVHTCNAYNATEDTDLEPHSPLSNPLGLEESSLAA